MNKEQFWKMIESARKKSGKDLETMHDLLLDALLKLPAVEIYRWGQYYAAYHCLSDTEPLYMAARVTGNGGDDGFEYFRGWLIAQGRKVYMEALADPDSLARLRITPNDLLSFEEMMGLGYEAYADKLNETDEEPEEQPLTDAEMEDLRVELVFADSTGLDSEDACIGQLPKRVPKLCKKFGYKTTGHEMNDTPGLSKTEAMQLAAVLERNAKSLGYFTSTGGIHVHYQPKIDTEMPDWDGSADQAVSMQIAEGKYLEHIDRLARFTQLKKLSFSAFDDTYDKLADFEMLEQLTQLEQLSIQNTPLLMSLDFVKNMPYLNRLCISHANELTDISAIEGLANLETVIMFDCPKIKAIPSLAASAVTLKTVRFMDNKEMESIEGLRGLQCVEDLWLEHNKITDISSLEGFTRLNHADLSRNKISNIDALKQLSHMETLDLSRNKITDIRPLGNLRVLKNLFLSGNNICDISPLANLQEIVYTLDLSKNKTLADISPLKNIKIGGLELKHTAVTDISDVAQLWYIDIRK